MVSYVSINAQSDSEKEFIELYKTNYLEWISSPEIARMQARNPELKALIDKIPVTETEAFKNAYQEAQVMKENGKSADLLDLFSDGAYDVSMDVIKELVSPDNTEIIINLYWKVIKSAESKEIVDLIMPHIEKARQDFEKAGVEIANTVNN